MRAAIELTTKISGVTAGTSGVATGAGKLTHFLTDNATLISLGFTAATLLVFSVSVWLKHQLDKKALELKVRELDFKISSRPSSDE